MKTSKNSVLKLGRRKPYDPISTVFDLPPALLEMSTLLEKAAAGDSESLKKAVDLQESIVTVTLENPTCVAQIRNLLANGYELRISLEQGSENDSKTSEDVSLMAS